MSYVYTTAIPRNMQLIARNRPSDSQVFVAHILVTYFSGNLIYLAILSSDPAVVHFVKPC